MARVDLTRFIERALGPEMARSPGSVLLSGIDTLRPGNFYIMGLNPGGDPKLPGHSTAIIDSMSNRQSFSCYLNECWQPQCDEPYGSCRHMTEGSVRPEFLRRHQRNMLSLFDALHADPRSVFATNAVFARSTSKASLEAESGHSLDRWWQACWPVHRELLAIVRPSMIISLGYGIGSSAFGLLWQTLGKPAYDRLGDNNRRGGWSFPAVIDLAGAELETLVVGIPHPSYLAIGPQLATALARLRARQSQ